MLDRIFPDHIGLAPRCRRNAIRRLSLFGSVLKGTSTPDSDVNLLMGFGLRSEHDPLRLAGIEAELSALLDGRRVDLRTAPDLSARFRDDVLRTAAVELAVRGSHPRTPYAGGDRHCGRLHRGTRSLGPGSRPHIFVLISFFFWETDFGLRRNGINQRALFLQRLLCALRIFESTMKIGPGIRTSSGKPPFSAMGVPPRPLANFVARIAEPRFVVCGTHGTLADRQGVLGKFHDSPPRRHEGHEEARLRQHRRRFGSPSRPDLRSPNKQRYKSRCIYSPSCGRSKSLERRLQRFRLPPPASRA